MAPNEAGQMADGSAPQLRTGMVVKGHGTQNDFVLLFDPEGAVDITGEFVRKMCDRRAGIGGDGLIRVVRSRHLDEPGLGQSGTEAEWFMDYRNADGSVAEMCGNGVRVFAHFLTSFRLVDGDTFPVGTRAGVKAVDVIGSPLDPAESWYRVDMGQVELPHVRSDSDSPTEMSDSLVETSGLSIARPGLSVDMGNPHTVVALAAAAELDGLELGRQPEVSPLPPNGTNVEYIVVEPDSGSATGRLSMRVFERGVGETYACGTGACAAAAAARHWGGLQAPRTWLVGQPGGTVQIDLEEGRVLLSGPAQLVAVVSPLWE